MRLHFLEMQSNKPLPKTIDLFSGCGGLALGFEKAGFDIAAGIELMPQAVKTISFNLGYRYGKDPVHICGDITQTDASIFKDRIGVEGCIVTGGPPCQAYSVAGRAKLKSLGEDRINTKDARGYLFQDYLRFIYDLDANAVVMENVPESVDFGQINVPETVAGSLDRNGYSVKWTILNAADYGVPQIRERVILVAIKKSLNASFEFPIPDHQCQGNRVLSKKKKLAAILEKCKYYIEPPKAPVNAQYWVTTGDALSDLPQVFRTSTSKYVLRPLSEEIPYLSAPKNGFQRLMRGWYGTEKPGVTANSFRNNKRDFAIFERMEQGDCYTEASRIADELFEREARMYGYEPESEAYRTLKRKMVPIYDRNKFQYKWQKLSKDKPSHTVVAHLSRDTYSHIHYSEPRGITVREAARLQSFPDDYYFNGNMGDAFKQIGNAVPPLLALRIAESIKKSFEEANNES